eukprot:SAG25_NODE_322_length_9886_cov_11.794217_1_plen_146_part_00
MDPVEQDIAATYEVGCVLEELLRCVDALDEIAPLDEQHCRPCQERRADAWCECDDAADQGWGDVCAACVLDERWCVACAAISAARVALLFRTRGAHRLRATARKLPSFDFVFPFAYAKVGSYGAPVCFRADFAAAAEILMRCTVL